MPNQVNDPGWDELFDKAGQQHNVDPLLLKSLMLTESGRGTSPELRIMTPSSAGALGPMQLLPKSFPNVDPYDPHEAIPAAAGYLAEGLEKYGGDVTKALMRYHGGPKTSIWGEITKAYPGQVFENYNMLKRLQAQPQPDAATIYKPDIIFGDSLAQQVNNHSNTGGVFAVGKNPDWVLRSLQQYAEKTPLQDKNVVLSSGISNSIMVKNAKEWQGDPAPELNTVAAQLQFLKDQGAKVKLMGVGPHPGLAGINDALQGIAKDYGATFVPLSGPFEPTLIHPKNATKTYEAILNGR